ncbi:late expression factor 6 [Lymantria dispar multiple nucleopolyhedrovirus]|jgi:hypothetical protein|uniref:Late expression factor 6 n=1 Tax=Lymantria dispar multicapsid nuclear polyhedrosis virus TaxID=10449 RepID=Q9YMT6_NPVLD|nr:late expression factor 6 [Lymantria dispar multiple nucleopolyhedrovirus]AAC70223.1 late expression factor 6 [Lymantria dispar multiple nucleopolyhedrovirus]AJR20310.1 lef-6 [Lymantria dispar multiple nucleopolyhedrovirus]AMO27536.1 LEF-6 [Lymantria dispar multiple nucleopolyhedrovirus]AQQ80058.1 lef-6 [Lymantria dispar multiple nucleopolyhedrovirus]QCQ67289.1 LEF-6 [Lymantria dispar multiple nucleopolyhedrovirus]
MGGHSVRINGGRYEKRFTKEFLTFVCGKRIDGQVRWDRCTRKLLSVATDGAVERLLRLDRRAFWPDGAAFRCSLDRRRRPRRRRRRLRRSKDSDRRPSGHHHHHHQRRRRSSPDKDEEALQQFIDVQICDDDERVDDFDDYRRNELESMKDSFNKMNIV